MDTAHTITVGYGDIAFYYDWNMYARVISILVTTEDMEAFAILFIDINNQEILHKFKIDASTTKCTVATQDCYSRPNVDPYYIAKAMIVKDSDVIVSGVATVVDVTMDAKFSHCFYIFSYAGYDRQIYCYQTIKPKAMEEQGLGESCIEMSSSENLIYCIQKSPYNGEFFLT